jgi:hypothetical protein
MYGLRTQNEFLQLKTFSNNFDSNQHYSAIPIQELSLISEQFLSVLVRETFFVLKIEQRRWILFQKGSTMIKILILILEKSETID